MKKTRLFLAMAFALVLGVSTSSAQMRDIRNVINSGAENITTKAMADNVSIEKIPTTFEEFQSLQAELGTTPEGCVMLQLVAMEMYRRDKNVGLQFLTINNTDTNLSSVTRRLNELYRENDSYARPYLVSSCFKGAKPSNGYNPNKPYTIEVRKDPTKNDERSQMLKGYVKHMQVYSNGYDTPWRNVDVVQQKDDTYYRVSNCPAILTQCKEIDFDASDDWHELQ